ncbi:MAG: type II toxin-antitoxin system VapC family toxin [Candidatus Bathyarchaeia archaeon]
MTGSEEGKPFRTVILDTNFLLIPLKFRLDIFEELERLFEGSVRCVIPTTVIEELRVLRNKSKPSMIRMIDFALSLAKKCDVEQVGGFKGETVDDSIIWLAKKLGCPVATNDSKLKRNLLNEKIPVIYLRGKDHLEISSRII